VEGAGVELAEADDDGWFDEVPLGAGGLGVPVQPLSARAADSAVPPSAVRRRRERCGLLAWLIQHLLADAGFLPP
jgi:hypothetical protein